MTHIVKKSHKIYIYMHCTAPKIDVVVGIVL